MTAPVRFTATSPRLAIDTRGDGEAVVFLHGIGGNRGNWTAQLSGLSDRFRCVAFDFRGYGDSDDAPGALDFFDFVDDVRRALRELDMARCHLVGLSMGGLVAQACYARDPSCILSLTLAGCRPGSAPVFEDSKSFADERTMPLDRGNDPEALADSLLPRLLGPAVDADARLAIRASLARLRPDSYRKVLKARLSIAPFLDPGDIAVPTLVLAATHDQVAPLAQMTRMAGQIPGGVLKVIPDTGHLMNIERPDLFNDHLRGFLTGNVPQASSGQGG